MQTIETISAPTENQLALATALGQEVARMLMDGEFDVRVPDYDPAIQKAFSLIASNLAHHQQKEALIEHAQAEMLSTLVELQSAENDDSRSLPPQKVVNGMTLEMWASMFAQCIDATEEPGDPQPLVSRWKRMSTFEDVMLGYIDQEVSDREIRLEYLREFRSLLNAEVGGPREGEGTVEEALSKLPSPFDLVSNPLI